MSAKLTSSQTLHSAATAQAEHQMERALLLNVVVRKRAAILELLARKNEALLIRRDTLLVLDLLLHVLNGVRGFDIQCDSFAGQGLDEDLHAHFFSGVSCFGIDISQIYAS